MKIAIALAAMLAVVAAIHGDAPKANYKVMHLSPTQVGVSCLNGGDPTGNKIGDLLIISCGR